MGAAATNINRATIYKVLSINDCKNGKKKLIVEAQTALIQLSQAKKKLDNNATVFKGLVIIMLIGNIY